MIIGNGSDFRNMLMNAKGTCPNCQQTLTFGAAAQLGRDHGISDNVVMCGNCHRVFEVNLGMGGMTLTSDVTARYPQIKPKRTGGLFGWLRRK